ncbi:MAG TPA: hypothetical protein VMA09_11505 [Candidatus Binataceae bacterium]|nr:hypothetical protein [Candidatus Binataceae bacterium]
MRHSEDDKNSRRRGHAAEQQQQRKPRTDETRAGASISIAVWLGSIAI